MRNEEFVWLVKLNGREAEVAATDKYEATQKAAKKLGVRWSQAAWDMEAIRLRRALKT